MLSQHRIVERTLENTLLYPDLPCPRATPTPPRMDQATEPTNRPEAPLVIVLPSPGQRVTLALYDQPKPFAGLGECAAAPDPPQANLTPSCPPPALPYSAPAKGIFCLPASSDSWGAHLQFL